MADDDDAVFWNSFPRFALDDATETLEVILRLNSGAPRPLCSCWAKYVWPTTTTTAKCPDPDFGQNYAPRYLRLLQPLLPPFTHIALETVHEDMPDADPNLALHIQGFLRWMQSVDTFYMQTGLWDTDI